MDTLQHELRKYLVENSLWDLPTLNMYHSSYRNEYETSQLTTSCPVPAITSGMFRKAFLKVSRRSMVRYIFNRRYCSFYLYLYFKKCQTQINVQLIIFWHKFDIPLHICYTYILPPCYKEWCIQTEDIIYKIRNTFKIISLKIVNDYKLITWLSFFAYITICLNRKSAI